MRSIILGVIVAIASLSLTPACSAQTLEPFQTRCSAGTYITCSYELYPVNSLVESGHVSQDFNRGASPQSEHDLYVQNSGAYNAAFTVSDTMDGNYLNYVPRDIVWSNAGQYLILTYTTAAGRKANIVFNLFKQSYGCGRTKCTGTFWTIWDGTKFQ